MLNEVCRICLATQNLIPIFLPTDASNYAADISHVTGTTIEPNDGLPQKICEECSQKLQSAVLLRAKSKQTEKCLIYMGFKRVQIYLHQKNNNECLADTNINKHKSEDDYLIHSMGINEDDPSNHSEIKLSEVQQNLIRSEIKIKNEPLAQSSHSDRENIKTVRRCKKTKGAKRKSEKRSKQKVKSDDTCVQKISSEVIIPEGTVDLDVEVKIESISTDELNLDSPEINTDDENVEKLINVDTKRINRTTKTKVKDKPIGKQKKEKQLRKRNNNSAETSFIQKYQVKSSSHSDYLGYLDGTYSKKGPYSCKECKLKWPIWNSFQVHVKRKHLKHTLICEYCARSFVTKTSLDRHCRSFHGMQRQLACPHCDFLALDRKQLVLHTRHAHTGEKPFICDACNTSFYDRRCLIQHIEGHRTTLDVKCPTCGGVFKSRRHLARHVFAAHASKRHHYRCSGCNNVYTNRKYARRHLTKLHPDLIATSKAALIPIEI